MRLSLSREIAVAALDEAFVARLRFIVGRAIGNGDRRRFAAEVFDLHSARDRALRIIDSNLSK